MNEVMIGVKSSSYPIFGRLSACINYEASDLPRVTDALRNRIEGTMGALEHGYPRKTLISTALYVLLF